MNLTRIFELEDKEFGDRLFKNAVFKGGGSAPAPAPAKQTTTTEPWAEQKDYLKEVFAEAKDWYGGDNPQYFEGETLAPFNAMQNQALTGIADYALSPRRAGLEAQAEAGFGELLGPSAFQQSAGSLMPFGNLALANSMNQSLQASPVTAQMMSGDPSQNPYLEPYIEAQQAKMTQNYMNNVLPQLRSSIVGYQPGGGSRTALAEGMATSALLDQQNQFRTQMANNAWQQAQAQQLEAMKMAEAGRSARATEGVQQLESAYSPVAEAETARLRQLGLGLQNYPGMVSSPMAPYQTLFGVGEQQRLQEQAGIEEAIARQQFAENQPLSKLMAYSNLVSGNLGGTSIATGRPYGGGAYGSGGGLGGGLAGAGSGALMGYQLGGPYGAMAGAVAGGLLGAF